MQIIFNVKDLDAPLPKNFAKSTQFIIQKTIRIILFFMGYYYLYEKEIKFDEKKYPKL